MGVTVDFRSDEYRYADEPLPPVEIDDSVVSAGQSGDDGVDAQSKQSIPAPWWTHSVSATELAIKDFPPLVWYTQRLIHAGSVTLLAGAPKMGKSYVAASIALAVAQGGKALGKLDTPPEGSEVLFIELDDKSERRMQTRLLEVGYGDAVTDNLTLHTTDNLDTGHLFVDNMVAYVRERPRTRLVVIDTLGNVKPQSGRDVYHGDQQFMQKLRSIITECPDVAILALLHTNKADDGEDTVRAVGGSYGITGGADTVLTLQGQRGSQDLVLYVSGRDVGTDKLPLAWTDDHGLVLSDEDPNDPSLTMSRAKRDIYRYVREFPSGLSPGEVADALGMKSGNVSKHLREMVSSGLVTGGRDCFSVPQNYQFDRASTTETAA